ncbi:hypothetical protein Pelo_166 [Pelomyxa schiedti]|nr:hypothetical protein Pelo_166 [Pelomyxa schiedti]
MGIDTGVVVAEEEIEGVLKTMTDEQLTGFLREASSKLGRMVTILSSWHPDIPLPVKPMKRPRCCSALEVLWQYLHSETRLVKGNLFWTIHMAKTTVHISSGKDTGKKDKNKPVTFESAAEATSFMHEQISKQKSLGFGVPPAVQIVDRLIATKYGPDFRPPPKDTNEEEESCFEEVEDDEDDEEEEEDDDDEAAEEATTKNGTSDNEVSSSPKPKDPPSKRARTVVIESNSGSIESHNDAQLHVPLEGIMKLPPNFVVQVFSYLSPKDLCSSSSVCHYWHQLCSADIIWNQCYLRTWPDADPTRIKKIWKFFAKGKTTWKRAVLAQYNWDLYSSYCSYCNFDVAGAAAEYIVARANRKHKGCDSDSPLDHLLHSKSYGEEVFYGPVYMYNSSAVAHLNELLGAISNFTSAEEFWTPEEKGWPRTLGGICPSCDTQSEDALLVAHHVTSLKMIAQAAGTRHCALLKYLD